MGDVGLHQLTVDTVAQNDSHAYDVKPEDPDEHDADQNYFQCVCAANKKTRYF